MRVGVVGPTNADSFADNITSCLGDLGVTAVALGPARPRYVNRFLRQGVELAATALPQIEQRHQQSILRKIIESEVDLVISADSTLQPQIVGRVRTLGIPICIWFPDAVGNINRSQLLLAPYSAFFFKEPLMVRNAVNLLGLPAFYLPEACNPTWHRPVETAAVEPHVVVVGNFYTTRVRLLTRLLSAGIPLRLYGTPIPPWLDAGPLRDSHQGRFVSRLDKAAVFRQAAAVLNNLHPSEVEGVNCRLFEATGSGGAVLCEDRPVLDDLFDREYEIAPFSSFDELVEKASFLLADRDAATRLGDAGSKRAHADHTYQHRLGSLLEIVT